VCLNNVARIRNSISTEEDTQWEDLNGGCDNLVFDLQVWQGRLYAAGAFQWCGYRKVNYAADYTYQSGANAEWSNLNNGLDGPAYSIEAFGGRLIFAGEFSHAGGLPVSGVAAWNTAQWRPLLPSCTDDCVPTGLQYYFNIRNSPSQVYNLKASKDGSFLYARAHFSPASSSSSGGARKVLGSSSTSSVVTTYLARWEYFDGQDLGIWTVKGPQAMFILDDNDKRGDGLYVNNGTLVLAGGVTASDEFTTASGALHTWDDDSQVQNWLGTHLRWNADVYVLRSSASSLSFPLAFVLRLF